MAKYSNTVEYNIKTTLDQTGLIQLQTQIRQVESNLKVLQKEKFLNDKSIDNALKKINEVRTVLNSSFNSKLGLMDNKALITGLNSIQGGINGVYGAFKTGGAQGIAAFNQLYGQITKVDQGLKQVSSTSDKIFNTLGNTVRWGLIASAFANVMNAAHQSVESCDAVDGGWCLCFGGRHYLDFCTDASRNDEQGQYYDCQHPVDEYYYRLYCGRCPKESQRL